MTAGRPTETDDQPDRPDQPDRDLRVHDDGGSLGRQWLTAAGGVAAGMLAITAIVGWWTVSAFALPWIAGIGVLVIAPVVGGLEASQRLRAGAPGVLIGAALGVGLGLVGVVVLLMVEPLAGMAGVVLPIVAAVIGAALGGAAVGVGRRLLPTRAMMLVVAMVIIVPVVAVLTSP